MGLLMKTNSAATDSTRIPMEQSPGVHCAQPEEDISVLPEGCWLAVVKAEIERLTA